LKLLTHRARLPGKKDMLILHFLSPPVRKVSREVLPVKAKLKIKIVVELVLRETSRGVPVLVSLSLLREIGNKLSKFAGRKSDCYSWSKKVKF
jgi:hypothetical protein